MTSSRCQSPPTLFPVNMTSPEATFWIIHWFYLSEHKRWAGTKSPGCKQSSPDFKHAVTAVPPFVIIEHHNTSGAEPSINHTSRRSMVHGSKRRPPTGETDGPGGGRAATLCSGSVLACVECIFLNRRPLTHFLFAVFTRTLECFSAELDRRSRTALVCLPWTLQRARAKKHSHQHQVHS